jgi:hypothetical protein
MFTLTELSAQNFFPIGVGDQFQEEFFEEYYDNFGNGWDSYTYPKILVIDSLVFNNIIFLKYNDKYFAYDSLQQQLFIYLNGNSNLAVDFNQPANTTKVLHFLGSPRVWRSNGISYKNILEKNRLVYQMEADTFYQQGPANILKTWTIEFAADIGLYYSYYRMNRISYPFDENNVYRNKVILAKIDTLEINIVNKSLSLIDSVRDRKISEFGYLLGVNIQASLPALISELYAEYNIYRNDNLISSRIFEIDKITFLAFINIQPEELEVGDIIKFKCVLKDTSIFNNVRTSPDTGYYEYKVLSNISSAEESENFPIFDYKLFQNFPNPFNSNTIIKFQIPRQSFVSLKIYDLLGNEIADLMYEEKPAGMYKVNFNTLNINSKSLASGLYFYQLIAGDYFSSKKLLLIK